MIVLNREEFILRLKKLLQQYEEMLAIHPIFVLELTELLREGGIEKTFITKLADNLSKLQKYGDDCIIGGKTSMEHLVGQYPLCSMRFLFPGSNIRVLFAYQDKKVYILSAFYERAGHKNTGYSKYTPVAKKRLEEHMEGE